MLSALFSILILGIVLLVLVAVVKELLPMEPKLARVVWACVALAFLLWAVLVLVGAAPPLFRVG